MTIKRAQQEDIDTLVSLTLLLWDEHTEEEMRSDLSDIMAKEDASFFLALEEGNAIGFAQCQLRYDYVEGTESSPVGYLEGIFVKEGYRSRGYARELLKACEKWALSRGVSEFASDCELDNESSLAFHLHMGFAEANRIICFTKSIGTD